MRQSRKVHPKIASAEAYSNAMARRDAWENTLTGLGTLARDKTQSVSFQRPLALSHDYVQLNSLYHFNAIAKRIVETIPEEMFRCGWDLGVKDEKDDPKGTLVEDFTEDAKRLHVAEKLLEGRIWGNLWGGALGIIGANDGQTDLSMPLAEDRIRSIDFINIIDKRYAWADMYYSDPYRPKYGEPATYRIFPTILDPRSAPTAKGILVVHESRVIRFDGARTDINERRNQGGWCYSALEAPLDDLKTFVQSFQATSALMADASQGVMKMKGLMQMIAGKNKEALFTRMQLVDMLRSVSRTLLLDADGEDFERKATSFAGIPDVLDRMMMLLSAATKIPVTLLMGRSAAGMNATGDSDFRAFYQQVATWQKNSLTPQLERIFTLMSLAKQGPSRGKPVKFTFDYIPLWQPTELEQSQTNQAQAAADASNVNAGILTPEEVAIARFKGKGSLQTHIDVSAREKSLKDGVSLEPYPNDPEPELPEGDNATVATPGVQPAPPGGVKGGKPAKTVKPATGRQ